MPAKRSHLVSAAAAAAGAAAGGAGVPWQVQTLLLFPPWHVDH